MKLKLSISTLSSSRKNFAKDLLEDEAIINWSILNKCILMLFLGSLVHITWVIWKSFVLFSPDLWQWVNLPLLKTQLGYNVFFLTLLMLMVFPCIYWRHNAWIKQYWPYLSVGIFVISLCRDGYLVGVLSPATMISYVCLSMLGLILFDRKIVYSMLIPATLFLFLSAYLSLNGQIHYAPIFELSHASYENKFWVLSMLFFTIPILATCLVLFEILLSQWRRREKIIRHLSQIDPLTNTFNRRSINACLENLEHQSDQSYAVVLIDLDHFKNINDQYGHDKGDEALIKVSSVLSDTIRTSDVVGRFGGEEFILILHHSGLAQAETIAERCRQAIQQIILLSDEGRSIRLSASFGIALSDTAFRPQHIISQADKALYQAKACGRNQVKCYAHNETIPLI